MTRESNCEVGTTEWGTLKRSHLSSSSSLDSPSLERARLVWRPSPQISKDLPLGFEIELTELGAASDRRFVPSHPEAFVLKSAQAGLAIISQVGSMDGEARNSYRTMHLLFQHTPCIQEALRRSFRRRQDLLVERAAREDVDKRTILPDELGFDASGKGTCWTLGRLMDAGRAAAESRDFESPDETMVIRLGIIEAARQNPVDVTSLSDADARFWLRTVTFDLGPGENISELARTEIVGRLLDALYHHLELSTDDFHAWFVEKRDNIVHQIAKRKFGGVSVSREDVRQVLLEMTFESFRYVGQCVSSFMHIGACSIVPTLNEHERSCFNALYNAERWLAGIPLVVLRPYLDAVREAVLDVLDDPQNLCKRGMLLRALQFHATMVQNRRRADRELKRARGVRTKSGYVPERDSAAVQDSHEILKDLMSDAGITCETCGRADLEFSIDEGDMLDCFTGTARCRQCEKSFNLSCQIEDLKRVVELTDSET